MLIMGLYLSNHNQNEGCHFAVYLPADQETADSLIGLPASHQLNMQIEIVREAVTGSVLVVDDQEEVRESLQDIFEDDYTPHDCRP